MANYFVIYHIIFGFDSLVSFSLTSCMSVHVQVYECECAVCVYVCMHTCACLYAWTCIFVCMCVGAVCVCACACVCACLLERAISFETGQTDQASITGFTHPFLPPQGTVPGCW